jgi:hypothetical protein
MGISTIPSASGGGIKLIQRGEAVSAGAITITGVETTKTFVRSFSTGSAGTVALTGDTTGTYAPSAYNGAVANGNNSTHTQIGTTMPNLTGTRTLSAGTMDATVINLGVHLTNSTTLTATGACRYEVVEFA